MANWMVLKRNSRMNFAWCADAKSSASLLIQNRILILRLIFSGINAIKLTHSPLSSLFCLVSYTLSYSMLQRDVGCSAYSIRFADSMQPTTVGMNLSRLKKNSCNVDAISDSCGSCAGQRPWKISREKHTKSIAHTRDAIRVCCHCINRIIRPSFSDRTLSPDRNAHVCMALAMLMCALCTHHSLPVIQYPQHNRRNYLEIETLSFCRVRCFSFNRNLVHAQMKNIKKMMPSLLCASHLLT